MNFEKQFNLKLNPTVKEPQIKTTDFKPTETKPKEPEKELLQSSREYPVSNSLKEISRSESRAVFEKQITPESKVCLIGDGQGADTAFMAVNFGIHPENIVSINYDQNEIGKANKKFKEIENDEEYKKLNLNGQLKMVQGDATFFEDFKKNNILENSQDIVTVLHVLETPDIKDGAERNLVENINKILKENGELLVSQYKQKLTREQAEEIGVEQIKAEALQKRFGDDWKEKFKQKYDMEWREGMLYSEISNIRTEEDLIKLFEKDFDIKLQESEAEYILKMKKKIETYKNK